MHSNRVEVRGAGIAARHALENLTSGSPEIQLTQIAGDKYFGRILANITLSGGGNPAQDPLGGGVVRREKPALKRIESRPIAKGRLFCLRCRLVLAVGDQVVDNSWIGKCRRIAQRAEVILGDLAQDAAHDLA